MILSVNAKASQVVSLVLFLLFMLTSTFSCLPYIEMHLWCKFNQSQLLKIKIRHSHTPSHILLGLPPHLRKTTGFPMPQLTRRLSFFSPFYLCPFVLCFPATARLLSCTWLTHAFYWAVEHILSEMLPHDS